MEHSKIDDILKSGRNCNFAQVIGRQNNWYGTELQSEKSIQKTTLEIHCSRGCFMQKTAFKKPDIRKVTIP